MEDMRPLDIVLALGAALRLTRFITTDTLGEWWIVRHAKQWAWANEAPVPEPMLDEVDGAYPTPDEKWGWRSKLVKGLDCPFCVGFWITGATLGAGALAARGPRRRSLFRFVAGVFAANYLTGHVSKRLD